MTEFQKEVLRVLKIKNPSLESVDENTPIDTDSLGLTELCILVEEHYSLPLTFAQAKLAKTVGEITPVVQ